MQRSCGGFTLIELLLVLGMMVLIVGAVGIWIDRSIFSNRARPADQIFYAAAAEARLLALDRGKPVRLSFDAEAQGFRIQTIEAASELAQVKDTLPWVEEELRWGGNSSASSRRAAMEIAAEEREQAGAGLMHFFPLADGSEARVTFFALYGEDRKRLGDPLDAIIFHPSGVSTPVEVVLEMQGADSVQILQPDTFANGAHIERRAGSGVFTSTGGWR